MSRYADQRDQAGRILALAIHATGQVSADTAEMIAAGLIRRAYDVQVSADLIQRCPRLVLVIQ